MTHPRRRLIILSNALDDRTRLERGISTDSPAASRKIFLAARAIATAGVEAIIVSIGRGKASGSRRTFKSTARRHAGLPIVYLRFTHRRWLTALTSLLAPVGMMWRLRKFPGQTTVLFYNQLPAYLPGLLMARLLGFHNVLDLEDGATSSGSRFHRTIDTALRVPFEILCSRALLACTMLAERTRLRPTMCYYGAVEGEPVKRNWQSPSLNVLFGGTIDPATGAPLLAEAIATMRRSKPWAERLTIEVTGKGSSAPLFEALAAQPGWPRVVVHGRTTDAEYRAVLARAHIGLALKPNHGLLADTTFPSKVSEFAGSGMLVLTTDISDVRAVLGGGARYLTDDDPALLIEEFRNIADDRCAAAETARTGALAVARLCAPPAVGHALADFLFPCAKS
jgi:hypothetical protein